MSLEPFVSGYFYPNLINFEETRTLALSDSPNRVIQIASEPDLTFIIDGILGVQITIPSLPSTQSPEEFNQSMVVISKKVNNILSNALRIRQDYYTNRNFITCSFFLKKNPSFAPVEREFFLTQRLSKWIKDQLSCVLDTKLKKEKWLTQTKSLMNILHRILTVPTDYENPILYYLQELYTSYSLNEEMFSVGHALERLSLPGIDVFKKTYDLGITDDAYLESTLGLEIAFRTQFLQTIYTSLDLKQRPNTNYLESAFSALYLNAVKWTLITTLKKNPHLQERFSQIPSDSPFWKETNLNKNWWDFIVKTLNPRICVYTLSPSQQPSAQ